MEEKMKLPAFESLDEKRDELAEWQENYVWRMSSQIEIDHADSYKFGFNAGVIERDKQWAELMGKLKAKVIYHREAYSLDIFPNSEKLDENSTTASISARMGRHMCDCFLDYMAEFYSPTQASEKEAE